MKNIDQWSNQRFHYWKCKRDVTVLTKRNLKNVVGYLSLRYQYLGSEFYDVDVTSTNIESSSSKFSRSA